MSKRENDGKHNMSLYYWDKLRGVERDCYEAVFEGLSSMMPNIAVNTGDELDSDDMSRIWNLVIADNPSLFYVGSAHSTSATRSGFDLSPQYTMSPGEISSRWADVERHLSAYKSLLPPSAKDYDKVLRAYEYIIKLCEYGFSENDQNMCSVFCDGISCCSGYSAAFKYLLDNVDVDCLCASGYVHGMKKTGAHAWNAVKVGGKWSWVDVTWGDPVMDGKDPEEVSYEYLCISDNYLSRTHDPAADMEPYLPRCTDDSNDWFFRNNMFFASYDPSRVESAIQGDVLKREIGFGKDDKGECRMKFARRSLLKTAKKELWDKMGIDPILKAVYGAYDLCPTDFSYSKNDELDSMTIRYRIYKKGA